MKFLLSIMISFLTQTEPEVSYERISRSATIHLNGPIEIVFPLFGPIKEKDWAEGWDPEIIYSKTNVVEQHMVFRTTGRHPEEPFYTWTITTFYPDQHLIEYTVSTANRVWFITVACTAENRQTTATITYTFTNLTDEGRKLNSEALDRMYANDLKDWELAINHYLKTGEMLTSH
jgi:hypothetical protein